MSEEKHIAPVSLVERFQRSRYLNITSSEIEGVERVIALEMDLAVQRVVRELDEVHPSPIGRRLLDVVRWHDGWSLRPDLVEALDATAFEPDWPALGMVTVEGEFAWLLTVYRGRSSLFTNDIKVLEYGGRVSRGYGAYWQPEGEGRGGLYIRAGEYGVEKFAEAFVERLALVSAEKALGELSAMG